MKRCSSSRFYEAYYTKGTKRFSREPLGKCAKFRKVTENDNGCERWQGRMGNGNLKRTAAFHYLRKISEDLSQIAQILEEDAEERREEEREKV